MTYTEAVDFLYSLRLFGAKFGLENTFRLAALAGNPQAKLRFIHVAGTNGKGSTCAMLESIYRAAGLRVGLFTSPHLVSFAERIQVNREWISERDVARLVGELREELLNSETHAHELTDAIGDTPFQPTFFEFVTVMALKYFAEQNCDLVIWETGMGGRLDATNIVTPLASVITTIDFDHKKWLGDSLEKIAAEKAGIIKPGVPVITATHEPEANRVIVDTARRNDSPLTQVSIAEAENPPLDGLHLPLPGEHQRLNAAVAVSTVHVLNSAIPVSDATIGAGLSRVNWPGRFQQIILPNGGLLILDGAHNPSGAKALRGLLAKKFPDQRITLILGILEDKDWTAMCEVLAPLAERIMVVPVSSDRTAAPEALESLMRHHFPAKSITQFPSLSEAMRSLGGSEITLITGSLYLIGEALELLGPKAPPGQSSERGLNEWNVTNPRIDSNR